MWWVHSTHAQCSSGAQAPHATRTDLSSRPWAPWYSIPADDKPFMRVQVAQILHKTLKDMDPRFPDMSDENRDALVAHQRSLQLEGGED